MSKLIIITGFIFILTVFNNNNNVNGLPGGSPVDTCFKYPPNQPIHKKIPPQSLATNPYQIVASSTQYSPGKQIKVSIRGDNFKGFYIQARDSKTHEKIGEFVQTPNTNVRNECSAITHADAKIKVEATLVWNAPTTGRGNVYFTGSVLKDFDIFWIDLVSK